MTITLNDPIVRVNGVQTPYFCLNNDFFKRIVANLRDDNIYDTSAAAVPYTNRIVTFTGTTDPNTNLKAFNEVQGSKRLISNLVSDATGAFEVSVTLRNGRNKISVETSTAPTTVSNSVYLNAYKLHAWLCLYAEEFEDIRNFTAQLRQDRKLRDSTDFDGNSIQNTGQGLTDTFGPFISIIRLPGFTVEEWREAIRSMFLAFKVAASIEAMNLTVEIFTDQEPEYKEYYLSNRVRMPIFTEETLFNPRTANPGVDTSIIWDDARIYLYNRWWVAEGTTITLTTGTTSYVYYDGTNRVTGEPGISIDYRISHIVSTTPPIATGSITITETIASGDIQIDIDGANTGLSGELFVRATFPVSGLNGVSGSAPDFNAGIADAVAVADSSYIDLGSAQVGQSKPQYFGDIFLSYETRKEIFEMGQFMTGSTEVTGMITGRRYDEVSGSIRELQIQQHAGELLVHGSQTLASGDRNVLTGVLRDVRPPRSFWHVFMEDPTSGELTFYAKV